MKARRRRSSCRGAVKGLEGGFVILSVCVARVYEPAGCARQLLSLAASSEVLAMNLVELMSNSTSYELRVARARVLKLYS